MARLKPCPFKATPADDQLRTLLREGDELVRAGRRISFGGLAGDG